MNANPNAYERLAYSIKETALMLGYSPSYIRLLIRKGMLPALTFDGVKVNRVPAYAVHKIMKDAERKHEALRRQHEADRQRAEAAN